MKANELRIGNWVKFINKTIKVFGGTIDDCYRANQSNAPFQYEPIRLTTEILEKAGFKKKVNRMQVDGIEMTLHLRGEEIPYGTWFSSCGTFNGGIAVLCLCRGNYFSANIHNLHDLQNMHYAITGRELTIDL